MVLYLDLEHSSPLNDFRLRATNKFLHFLLLHRNCLDCGHQRLVFLTLLSSVSGDHLDLANSQVRALEENHSM
jgi:hypothetical protein